MAYIHFVAHKRYAQRVVQLGENPARVFVVGAPALDAIRTMKWMDKEDLAKYIGFHVNHNTALVTFNPETNHKGVAQKHIAILLRALSLSRLKLIFTMPNADSENSIIAHAIERFVKRHPQQSVAFTSLGRIRYFSLMRYVGIMIGNSSSGILEAPSFKLPVVNVGNRQQGRIIPRNVITVSSYNTDAIRRAIVKASASSFRHSLLSSKSPFGDSHAAQRITKIMKSLEVQTLEKGFWDLKSILHSRI